MPVTKINEVSAPGGYSGVPMDWAANMALWSAISPTDSFAADQAFLEVASISSVRVRWYYDSTLDGGFPEDVEPPFGGDFCVTDVLVNDFGHDFGPDPPIQVMQYPDQLPPAAIYGSGWTLSDGSIGLVALNDTTFDTNPITAGPWSYAALVATYWYLNPNPRDGVIADSAMVASFEITWTTGGGPTIITIDGGGGIKVGNNPAAPNAYREVMAAGRGGLKVGTPPGQQGISIARTIVASGGLRIGTARSNNAGTLTGLGPTGGPGSPAGGHRHPTSGPCAGQRGAPPTGV